MGGTSSNEPIAIVGTACRFPGGASSPSKLWELLHHPRDLSRKPSSTRYNADGFYHPNPEHHTTANVTNSYFLEDDYRHFDAAFFNVTPKEAEAIDPQQRLLLETVYEGMESAGYTLKGLEGSATSVYVGLMCNDFHDIQFRDPDYLPQYIATGASRAIISNRVSYFFDWKGPSMTIDTACSSSLVAIHQAVQSLRSGESRVACAAGANLLLSPEYYQAESNLHMLSPSGKSQMWDANADGYARGEGIAAVFLKPLSSALADGDYVHALVRETGVNSDGRTKGITMPSNEAQLALIRATYAKAGLDPLNPQERCQYFEAHGTGTPAGDPMEASAISQAFFDERSDPREKLLVGSIKTIIGHTEGAAGVAGVLKAVLAMQKGIVPPNQHLKSLNPAVKPFYTHLNIPTSPQPWPATPKGLPLRASVNSFGFGGTNSHIILESFDPAIRGSMDPITELPTKGVGALPTLTSPVVLSAHTEKALLAMVEAYSSYLNRNESVNLRDLAWALQTRRTALPVKVAFPPSDRASLIAEMDRAIERGHDLGTRPKLLDPDSGPRILGVFTGQGAQWPMMGRSMILCSNLFRQTIEKLELYLSALPESPTWSLKKELMAPPSESRLEQAALSQPLCTAIQVALVDVLDAVGVSFHTVIGHSSGEISAAYASGFITAEEAIQIAYYRGYFAHFAHGEEGKKGGMLAAGLSFNEAKEFCNRPYFKHRIVVAASNSPSSVTLSGDLDAIKEAKQALDADGKFARVLKVDTAYHSPHMHPCSEPYLNALRASPIKPKTPKSGCVWLSSVYSNNGRPRKDELSGTYWRDNMVNPVLFSEAVRAAWEKRGPFDVVIEVGPHAALKGPATETIKEISGNNRPYRGVLRRGLDDVVAFGDALGFLWSQLPPSIVDFEGFAQAMEGEPKPYGREVLKGLPSYPWEHNQIHWREGRMAQQYRSRPPFHELLGSRLPGDVDNEPRWRNLLRADEVPWLRDHRFQGQIIVPAAAYCVMALDAAKAVCKDMPVETFELRDLDLENAITLPDGPPGSEVLFSLRQTGQSEKSGQAVIDAEYNCFAGPADTSGPIKKIFSGNLSVYLGQSSGVGLPEKGKMRPILYPIDLDSFYSQMADIGLNYSGSFQGLRTASRRLHMSTAKISAPDEADGSFMIHPITLDVCFQAIFAAYASPDDGSLWTSFLPRKIGRIVLNVAECQANVESSSMVSVDASVTHTLTASSSQLPAICGDLHIYNEATGRMEVLVEDLTVSSFSAGTEAEDRQLFLEDRWELDILSDVNGSEYHTDPCLDQGLIETCERLAHFYLRGLAQEGTVTHVIPAYQNLINFSRQVATVVSNGDLNQRAWESDTDDDVALLFSKYPNHPDLNLIKAVGERLPSAISGDIALLEDEYVASAFNRFLREGMGVDFSYRQMGSVVKQIAHKHPRMSILEIGVRSGAATKHILEELQDTFSSYTIASTSAGSIQSLEETSDHTSKKVALKELNLKADLEAQGFEKASFDVVIATDVSGIHVPLRKSLSNIRQLLKPGGFVVLFEPTGSLARHPLMMSVLPHWWSGEDEDRSITGTAPLVKWDRLLRQTGYSGIDAAVDDTRKSSTHQMSVMISQATNDLVKFLRKPLQSRKMLSNLPGKVLIVGGRTLETSRMIGELEMLLEAWSRKVVVVDSIDSMDENNIRDITAVLSLEDLDGPFIRDFTARAFRNLQVIVEQVPTVLWLVRGYRENNPYHAASIGLLRSIAAESPQLHVQVLDVENTENKETYIAECLLRLVMIEFKKLRNDKGILWTTEQELILECGKYILPRVVPVPELNDRLNSSRRVLYRDVNVWHTATTLARKGQTRDESKYLARRGSDRIAFLHPSADHRSLQLSSCSLFAVHTAEESFLHLARGSDLRTGESYVAFVPHNSSIITVPTSWTVSTNEVSESHFSIESALLYLIARRIADLASDSGSTILHGLGESVAKVILKMASSAGKHIICTTNKPQNPPGPTSASWFYLHPHASKLMLLSSLPKDLNLLIDLTNNSSESRKLINLLPSRCMILRHDSIYRDKAYGNSVTLLPTVIRTVLLGACSQKLICPGSITQGTVPTVGSRELLDGPKAKAHLSIIDWTSDEYLPVLIRPLDHSKLFCSNNSYLLVGLTGELGQSLCRWMIRNGARHIVISSRNPQRGSKWENELRSMGANLRIEACDVTDKEDVVKLVQLIRETMPPIAGVVNGAMVMQDKPFADMNDETLRRVLSPKIDGSKNLDEVFWDSPLDFFIMTSSTAAVIGNPGQANYAAANQYMVGLAAQRKKRGVAGSVVDIGMIMGIGYIRRSDEKGTYEHFLGKQNLMPIAEKDVRDIFAEAICGGHPVTGTRSQVMTGLAKIDLSDSSKRPSWITNPRFSHHNFESGTRTTQNGDLDASSKGRLRNASSAEEASETLQEIFSAELAVILQLPSDGVNRAIPLLEMGADSLVAVEIRSWFLSEIGVDVPVLKLLGGATVVDLCNEIAADILAAQGGMEENADTAKAIETAETVVPRDSAQQENMSTPSDQEKLPQAASDSSDTNSLSLDTKGQTTPDTSDPESPPPTNEVVPPWYRIDPMSYGQTRIWFPSISLQDKTAYNCTTSYHLKGSLDNRRLEKALRAVTQRHEAFRTTFHTDSFTGEAKQVILRKSKFRMRRVTSVNDSEDVRRAFDEMHNRVYDLESGDTFRVDLLSHSSDYHTIIFGYHHIIMDGVSWQLTLQDIERYYISPNEELPRPCQYTTFATKQRERVENGTYAKEREFWKSQFQDLPDTLPLFSFAKTTSRKSLTNYDTLDLIQPIDVSLTGKVKAASKKAKVTTFHFYLAAFQVLLNRFLSIEDVCIGVVDANRNDQEFMQTIGFLLNFLPLRFNLEDDPSFEEITQKTRTAVYGALGKSAVPIDLILKDLDVSRSASCPPLFQVIFNYRMGALKQKTIGDVDLDWHDYKDARNPYDITISVDEKDDGTGGYVSLSLLSYLFDQEGGDLLMKAYVHILEQVSADLDIRLSECELSTEFQSQEAVTLGIGTKVENDWPETISKRIGHLIETQPEEMALKDSFGKTLYYQQMGDRVNAIAAALGTLPAVHPGSHVGIFCEPSADLVCSLLAVMRIGAVYVPLDSNMPVERLELICDEARLQALVHDNMTIDRAKKLVPHAGGVVNVSTLPDRIAKEIPDHSLSNSNSFIMFTSGSTGRPKGVQLTHGNYLANVTAVSRRMGLQKETVLQQSSVSFDLSLAQIFYCLANGGTLVVANTQKDPAELAELIRRESITFTFCVPSEYSAMIRYGSESLKRCDAWRLALSSGEAFPGSLREKFRDLNLGGLTVLNSYGPTEASVIATMCEVDYRNIKEERIPIGQTLDNYSVYVVDDEANPLPTGLSGELVLGGPGISPGYLRNEALTKEKFIPDQISGPKKVVEGWTTVYRTGDTARVLGDGSLIYQGRREGDSQVKLRGVRIELEDISNTILRSSNGVLFDAAVIVKGEAEKFLVAFVVFSAGHETEMNSLQYLHSLRSTLALPSYMRPSVIKALPQLPTSAAGKLDRRALSDVSLGDISNSNSRLNMTVTERRLSKVWETVLLDTGIVIRIGKESDFFSVGGNSLLLLKLQAEIRDQFSVELSLPDLFQVNTLEGLASRIDALDEAPSSESIDWDVESDLPEDMSTVGVEGFMDKDPTKPLTVLLTGSTGFLGRAICEQLSIHPRIANIECLAVRNPRATQHRSNNKKVTLHSGDLTRPFMGMPEAEATELFERADVIIHNGADVSFMKTYQSLRQPNVWSTKELARLAAKFRIPFHFISTSGVAHLSGKDTYEEISVSPYKPPTNGIDGYVASKWASERFLEKLAAQTGMPIWIHRPTSITGENTPEMDIVHTTLKFSRLLKAVPELPNWGGFFDFVDVNNVARVILEEAVTSYAGASARKSLKEPVYVHHCGDMVIPVHDVRVFVQQQVGEPVKALGLSDWIAAATEQGMNELVASFMRLFADGQAHSLVLPRLIRGKRES